MDYAVIKLGGKQHRVRDGETLVVDRLPADAGGTITPDVLLGDDGVTVTATVLEHGRGPKIRIGKYRRRTGYKRHTGFRAATTKIEISLGGSSRRAGTSSRSTAAEPRTAAPAAPPAADTAPEHEHVKGMPAGYEDLTVAQVKDGSASWNRPMLEAALTYEQANANRKGAIAALESALAAKEESN
jgi:large subunit ribosomal protein L21